MNSVLPAHQAVHNQALADTLDRIAALTAKLSVLCEEAYEQTWRMDNNSLCRFFNEIGDYDVERLFLMHYTLATGCNLAADFTKSQEIRCTVVRPENRFVMSGHIFCPLLDE
jgi:hypothetical protein